jgi:hypothetical protein
MRTIVRLLSALALVAAIVPATASAKKPAPKASVAKWAKKNHLKGSWKTKDADRDGLKNLNEYKAGTNPRKADTDADGLKDGDELKVGDDPTKRDSDGDAIKDGAEHAGTVTAVSGDTMTITQFKGGKLTAKIAADADCYGAEDLTADDSSADDDASDDGSADDDNPDDGYWGGGDDDNSTGDDGSGDDASATAATVDDDETVVQLAQTASGDDTADDSGDDTGADDASAGDSDFDTCADAGVKKGTLLRSAEFERDGGQLFFTALEIV